MSHVVQVQNDPLQVPYSMKSAWERFFAFAANPLSSKAMPNLPLAVAGPVSLLPLIRLICKRYGIQVMEWFALKFAAKDVMLILVMFSRMARPQQEFDIVSILSV